MLDDFFNFGSMFSGIAGLLKLITDALLFLAMQTAAALNFIWSVLVNVWNALRDIFSSVRAFLDHLWNVIVKTITKTIPQKIIKLRDWLKRTLDPIINNLQKIKQWYDDHILKWQFRIINLIQRVRQALSILTLFHIKFAQTLDKYLADLQRDVAKSIEVTRGKLNEIISALAVILDPSLLIRGNVLGASLLTNVGALKRIVGYGDNRPLTSDEQKKITFQATRYQSQNVNAHVTALATTGLTAQDQQDRAAARAALTTAFGAPLPI